MSSMRSSLVSDVSDLLSGELCGFDGIFLESTVIMIYAPSKTHKAMVYCTLLLLLMELLVVSEF